MSEGFFFCWEEVRIVNNRAKAKQQRGEQAAACLLIEDCEDTAEKQKSRC